MLWLAGNVSGIASHAEITEHVRGVRDSACLKKTWEIKEGGTFLPLWPCRHNALSEHCN